MDTINCPNCEHEIDVNHVLSHKLEIKYKKEYQSKLDAEKQSFEARSEQLQAREAELLRKQKEQALAIEEAVQGKLLIEKKEIQARLKKQITEEASEEMRLLKEELAEKSQAQKELTKVKAESERLKRLANEAKETAEYEAEKKLNKVLDERSKQMTQRAEEKYQQQIKEFEIKLQQQTELTNEMKRKQEQGSMQLQGEAQELLIEEFLAAAFPTDEIEEIKKGANGADCLQHVNKALGNSAGTIYYESKRTKEFKPAWIAKFKADMVAKGADIGVIVTEVMPKDMATVGEKDGIWICTISDLKLLAPLLRGTLLKLNSFAVSQESKGDKMVMLYDYLTSSEFKLILENLFSSFEDMKDQLDSEKRSMKRIWTMREKQLEKIELNAGSFHGALSGIAGKAIPQVKNLELDAGITHN